MQKTEQTIKRIGRVAGISGGLYGALGLLAISGFYSNSFTLIQAIIGLLISLIIALLVYFAQKNLARAPSGEPASLKRELELIELRCAEGTLRSALEEMEKRIERRTSELLVLNEILAQEVTNRKMAENALCESETRAAGIINSAMQAIITVDSDQRIIFFNHAAEVMFGCSADDAMGGPLSQFIPSQFRSAHDQHIRALRQSGIGSRAMDSVREVSGLRASGEEFPIEASISQVEAHNKKLYTVMLRDITERKQAEDALRKAHEELELRVEKRTAELLAANLQLEASLAERTQMEVELQHARDEALESVRLKSQFVANMSHEVRTPMNGIIGMTDIVLKTELTDQQRQCLKLVKRSADSLLTVINDILDFSKIEAGKLDFDLIDFNLSEALGDTIKSLGARAHAKGLELTCHIAGDTPDKIVGDPGRLRQVIINLVSNAIKFTERGEVMLRVERLRQKDDKVLLRFAVTDTGIGIPQEQQKVIFDSFVQADGTTGRLYGGTGLGLSISSRLVEIMGGRISIESEVGQGSRFDFSVWFELSKNFANDAVTFLPSRLRGLPVLVIDDNLTNCLMLAGLFNNWHFKSTIAVSGQEALELMREAKDSGHPFSLAVIDAEMPGIDGFQVAEQIKLDPKLAESVILMLPVTWRDDDQIRCSNLSLSASLYKPITQPEMLKAIRMAFGEPVEQADHFLELAHQAPVNNIRRLRVLLAEDNEINQQLAVHLLEGWGHSVVVAQNGRAALAALEKERFDIVLMDIQMPLMTGFEAATAIREIENTTGDRIPIIAMTAYAMKGDRERFLAAGMDGYISKPIQADEFFIAVNTLASFSSMTRPDLPPVTSAVETSANKKLLDHVALLASVNGNTEFLVKLAGIFLKRYPAFQTEIRNAIIHGDKALLSRTAHSFRGCGSFLTPIAMDLLTRLETMGEEGNLDEGENVVAELDRELMLIQREITELLTEVAV